VAQAFALPRETGIALRKGSKGLCLVMCRLCIEGAQKTDQSKREMGKIVSEEGKKLTY